MATGRNATTAAAIDATSTLPPIKGDPVDTNGNDNGEEEEEEERSIVMNDEEQEWLWECHCESPCFDSVGI